MTLNKRLLMAFVTSVCVLGWNATLVYAII